ncbi:MAG: YhgN family NAAT transporter [Candidatus Dasytiphilus stammeri]
MSQILSTAILLFLIMDPLGNLPIFMVILKPWDKNTQYRIIIREMILALIVMFLFLFLGEKFLHFLDLKTEVVSMGGGIVLLLIALKMLFPSSNDTGMYSSTSPGQEPFLVPLAMPLVAGPTLLATIITLSHVYESKMIYMIIALIIAWIANGVVLLSSGIFVKLLGEKGLNALERIMGLIFVMLATQMFLNGVQMYYLNNFVKTMPQIS